MPTYKDVGGQVPQMAPGSSPADVAYAQRMAQMLMQGGQGTPRHWAEALGNAMQMGVGGLWQEQAARGDRQGQAQADQLLINALTGGTSQAAPTAQPVASPQPAPTPPPMEAPPAMGVGRFANPNIAPQPAAPVAQTPVAPMNPPTSTAAASLQIPPEVRALLSNPRTRDQGIAMIQDLRERQRKQNDPSYQLGLRKTQAEIAKLEREAGLAGSGFNKDLFNAADKLRGDFQGVTKDFRTVRDSFNTIETVANLDSPAGDMGMLYAYMRMLDPGSVVRESEFAMAARTGNVPTQVANWYNKMVNGTFSHQMRADFLRSARAQYKSREKNYKKVENQFSTIARRAGLDPKDVIVDYTLDPRQEQQAPPAGAINPALSRVRQHNAGMMQPQAPAAAAQAAPTQEPPRVATIEEAMKLPPGTVFIDANGVPRRAPGVQQVPMGNERIAP